ncbi:MAG: metalloregulator ArsR/SmtB family transcription factor [Spirochaetales bacterium]|nr:metalloregulator ArsR/SmtB family transcription factor [Spirochaetales bacterium]MCF7937170.1 metalloregulator ArsR/SmtB family transcription factor [Spirochaetales bacterium]
MIQNTCCPDSLIEEYAQKLKVCGHPLRLKILCLIEREDACVTDLWQCLDQPQPVISQHLAVLKDKGIVRSEIQGNKRIYSIQDAYIKSILQGLGNDRIQEYPDFPTDHGINTSSNN